MNTRENTVFDRTQHVLEHCYVSARRHGLTHAEAVQDCYSYAARACLNRYLATVAIESGALHYRLRARHGHERANQRTG